MISFKVLALSSILFALCSSERKERGNQGNLIKFVKECNSQHGFTAEMRQTLDKKFPEGLYKPEDVPKEYLCSIKCIDEKIGILKDGKYDMKNMEENLYLMQTYKTPEKYLKCLKEIDGLNDCEDYRKTVKCNSEFGDTHMRECSHKFKTENREGQKENKSRKDKNHHCFLKCIYESKGILDKDGKLVVERAKEDIRFMIGVKNKDQFFDCLKDLEIKECGDLGKIRRCKKN